MTCQFSRWTRRLAVANPSPTLAPVISATFILVNNSERRNVYNKVTTQCKFLYLTIQQLEKRFLVSDLQQHKESHRETNDPEPWQFLVVNRPRVRQRDTAFDLVLQRLIGQCYISL